MPRWTTKGDKLLGELTPATNKIPYFTGANTAGRLDFSTNTALGTSNTTVPSQNAVKAYVDALATGSSVLASVTISGNPSAIEFTTGFNQTYIRHDLILHDVYSSTTTATILLQGSNDNGNTWLTAATFVNTQASHAVGGSYTTNAYGPTATSMGGPITMNNTIRRGVSGVIQILGGSISSQIHYRLSGINGSGNFEYNHGAGSFLSSSNFAHMSAIRIVASTGTFAGGRITLTGQLA